MIPRRLAPRAAALMAVDFHVDTLSERTARSLISFIRRRQLGTLRFWGRTVGAAAYRFLGRSRQIALNNLEIAYGEELDLDRRRQIARMSFVNLATTVLESCYAPRFQPPMSDHIEVNGVEHLRDAHSTGKGTIFLVPHMGNWEISARYLAEMTPVVHAVTRRQKPVWLDNILREIRRGNGIREIDNRGAVRPCLEALRRGEMVVMLIDQYIARGSVAVQFFGRPAMTSAAPALLALRTGCSVLVGACYRRSDGGFGGAISPPIEHVSTGDREHDLVANTQRYVDVLEEFVRRHPEEWMWMHDRWKPPRPRKRRRRRA